MSTGTNLEQSAPNMVSTRLADMALRTLVGFDLVLMALGCIPVSGVWNGPTVADRLFGHLRLGGFRPDFLWLAFTTIFLIGVAGSQLFQPGKKFIRLNIGLCALEAIGFLAYLFYSVIAA